MKQVLLLLIIALSATSLMSQAPALVNYQGVARNSVGNVLPNQNIRLRLTIHDSIATGTVIYQETRSLKTNYYGMFTVAIGGADASNVTGSMAGINWGKGGDKFLQVEIDPTGGNNLINMGAAQLLSVPYAMYSGSAAPSGTAGGALTGSYPNPDIAANAIKDGHIADSSITAAKLAPGVLSGASGNAGGDLNGSYPNPSIAANAITTTKVADGAITLSKLQPGIIPSSLPPSGTAGGDLSGSYPNPSIALNAITAAKIADRPIVTSKVADGSITLSKLEAGIIPSTLPPVQSSQA